MESWLAQVVPELLPMNPAVSCFRMIVRQVDLARPEAPLKIVVCGHGLAPVYRLTVGAQTQKSQGVKHVRELPHQVEPGSLVRIGWCSEIFLEIGLFLRLIGDEHIRHHRYVGIPIILERSLPVHHPQTASLEEHVVRFEQVVVTRRRRRIKRRVSRRQLLVLRKKFYEVVFRQDVRGPELLEEPVQGRPFTQQERARGIEGGYGKRRQRGEGAQGGGYATQRVRCWQGYCLHKISDRDSIFGACVPDGRR